MEQLRESGVSVLTTHEARNGGQDDGFQAVYAARRRRVLLTNNVRHFLDDRLAPPYATRGIIALDADTSDSESYWMVLEIVRLRLVPWADSYEHMNIRVTRNGIVCRFIDGGSKRTVRLTVDEFAEGRYPTDQFRTA